MSRMIKSMCMFLIATVCMAVIAPRGDAAIGCGTVVSYMKPCIPYVSNKGPPGGCCGGVKGLYSAAKTTPDRQSVCGCLKSLSGSINGINYGKVGGLPGLCGVSIPYKISPSTDCSKVK
ncbi:hypothetical protein RD792_012149 [Penstemon davidsonii]|uniref:Non-specific lipid-transfer protein n=1 Tax=Penstemon davidsonii TaxID=160366 RepID=A0ABR0CWI2_9LAMI|nr:hypothetical protein RD792_012149 [Penstemon davidsonii]